MSRTTTRAVEANGGAGAGDQADILVVTNLTKRFGGLTAIDSFDLRIPEHQIHSVIGPNGAGKTTLFNCITGFYVPDEGDIVLGDGQTLVHLRPDEINTAGVARTYQNIRVFPELTAIENILIGLHGRLHSSLLGVLIGSRNTRREERWATEEALALLDFVGLADQFEQLAMNLPYGDQRRLEIARALAGEPRLLLLDEPTAGMNPNETAEMIQFIRRLPADRGITVLLIEHDMRVVMACSEHITVMDFGEKIAEGTAEEIQSNPRVIEAYLGRGAGDGLGDGESSEADGHESVGSGDGDGGADGLESAGSGDGDGGADERDDERDDGDTDAGPRDAG